eukprot:NODE_306_length_11344_cov_0.675767.p5 type:complete len:268 gc:universal NODE_306_length_11344_cov_0.675767:9856-10659(+)
MSLTLKETINRGLETIYTLVCSLNLPYSTMYIANSIFQKAYLSDDVQRRFKDRKYFDVAIGSLYIALKLEECRVDNDEIINVINRKAKKREDLLIKSDTSEYARWKRIILYMEPYILHQLAFRINVDNPFTLLTAVRRKYDIPFVMFQLTHTVLGDCCRSDICCRTDSSVLVASCMYIAGCILDIEPYNILIEEVNDLNYFWGITEFEQLNVEPVSSVGFELLKSYGITIDVDYSSLPPLSPDAFEDNLRVDSPKSDEELEEGEMVE